MHHPVDARTQLFRLESRAPFILDMINENVATPGTPREVAGDLATRGAHLNFPVRTCSARIPHRWAPPTSPTMSSPIMTACQQGKALRIQVGSTVLCPSAFLTHAA